MTMVATRYEEVRKRLIELRKRLQHRTYGMWIAPEKLMSLEEIRDRPTLYKEGYANDKDYYSQPQMRRFNIPQILEFLPNINNAKELGFENSSKVIVEIYENIQEYNRLWVEIIKNVPEFEHPPLWELRAIEKLAYVLYRDWRQIKPYHRRAEQRKLAQEDDALNQRGLLGLAALFTATNMHHKRKDDFSFISYLDEICPEGEQFMLPESLAQDGFFGGSGQFDGLGAIEPAGGANPNWIFQDG